MTARDRTVIVIVCALAAVAGAWLLVIQPKRGQASKLGDQVKSAQTQLNSARAQVAQGEAARSTFASNYSELARLGEAVPADDDIPSLIYQLQSAASAAHVDFRALHVTPGTAVAAPTASAAPAAQTTTTTGTPAQTTTATPAASATSAAQSTPAAPAASTASAAQAVTATLPPGAAIGPAGFPTEPFTFTFQGNFFHLADFFNRLERFVVATNKRVSVGGRLMTLNAITLGAAQQGFPQITASISATTYIVPAAQGLLNGATPTGPAGGSSPRTVSTTSSSVPAAPAVATAPAR